MCVVSAFGACVFSLLRFSGHPDEAISGICVAFFPKPGSLLLLYLSHSLFSSTHFSAGLPPLKTAELHVVLPFLFQRELVERI